MSMSDPLADMLTRIRNASLVKLESVNVPLSKIKKGVAEILRREGYIKDYQVIKDTKQGILQLELKYDEHNHRVITGIKRISKPGRRIYVNHQKIPKVMSGLGISILSTSKGVLTDHDAKQMGIGGEYLCEVW